MVIVASLGGVGVVSTILSGLPPTFAVHVLVVQHGRSADPEQLTRVLQRRSALDVRTAESGMTLDSAGVTVIPHRVSAMVDAARHLQLGAAVGPTVGDAVLASAAESIGPGLVGVVLTGRLRDGTEGVRAVKRRGGRVIAQDPATAQGPDMPASAIATGCVDFVLPPERIAAGLVALTMAPGGAELLAVPTPHWANLAGPRPGRRAKAG